VKTQTWYKDKFTLYQYSRLSTRLMGCWLKPIRRIRSSVGTVRRR